MKAETLKKAILQYAMEGKLVAQDQNDEPASELLKRIKAEKEQLIKDGKLKKEKLLPPITEEEIPYELPQGWDIARLGNVLDIARGGSPRPIQAFLTTANDGLNWIKIGDTDKGGKYISSTKEKIIREGLSKTRYVKKGDFLLSNSMSFGRPYILNIDGCIHDGWLVLSSVEKCFDKDFLYYLLSSYYIFTQFCGSVSGAVVKNLNSDKVANAVVCIPPLEEQKRIVEKLEEILPLVEEYGKNEEKFSKLNETLPKKIRQSILQHAVQGKLVPQNPNDEPASELLKRIKAEKEQLIKDGKLKKEKPLPPITEEEIPYELPQGWEWVRLGEIIKIKSGNFLPASQTKKDGTIPVYGGNGINGYHDEYLIDKPTLVIGRVGFYCGCVHLTKGKAWVTDNAFITEFSENNINIQYLKWLLRASNLGTNDNATAQPVVSGKKIYPIVVALPPLEEQKRIVAKVDELMQLVDKLK